MVASAHGVYRGGLGVHLALAALAGDLGAEVDLATVPVSSPFPGPGPFSESCGRVILTVDPKNRKKSFEKLMAGCCLGADRTGAERSNPLYQRWKTNPDKDPPETLKGGLSSNLWRPDMMKTPRALVLTGYGLNCDLETQYALTLAGFEAERVHISELINPETGQTSQELTELSSPGH